MEARVVVRTTGASPYANEVAARGHRLAADEPAAMGGADTGPAPFEYLLAGLGACTSMTIRMYAARKGWNLEGVEVALELVKAEGVPGPDNRDRIRRTIGLEGDLDEEARARLLDIASRCPVHRSLEAGIDVETAPK